MWVYTCSACGEQFVHADQPTAAADFEEHARTVHNPDLLVTFTAPTDPASTPPRKDDR